MRTIWFNTFFILILLYVLRATLDPGSFPHDNISGLSVYIFTTGLCI